jgi:hypothetical protein
MKPRPLIVSVLAAGALAVALPLLVAGQTPNQPGQPTLARVHILNRDRAEAVPVKVQNTGDSLPVVLVGEPTVSLAASAVVATRSARQVWEYRRIVVGAGDDPTAALNAAGTEGWEAVSGLAAGTGATWLLKRPR